MNPVTSPPSKSRQSELGQFLTSEPVAEFMASMFSPLPQHVRLLDAGAGNGKLTQAFIDRVCQGKDHVQSIEVSLYELDLKMIMPLTKTMRECQRRCTQAGIKFNSTIHPTDFIQDTTERLVRGLLGGKALGFDAAIANPPYRKISANSLERQALRTVGIETSNLYTGFIALIQRLLVSGGQLVGITPRSFCNGPYFRPFREDFLTHMELRRIHVFESRQAAFRSDGVLQENIIFHAAKGRKQPHEMTISSSSGEPDGDVTVTVLPFEEVVHPNDGEKFIHIPSSTCHSLAKQSLKGLDTSLGALGVRVSTGRVVDFRLKDALRNEPEAGTVPLLYPCHFNGGTVHWPKLDARKPNAILDNEETRPWLVPSGVYLLTKRFTAKEESRRLVACIFDPSQVKAEWIGFENHLNYFHANGAGMDPCLAYGLYAFLNSTVVDQYFRRFSGHTQVNATDLRTLAYPNRETLRAMGAEILTLKCSQSEIDQLVSKYLHAPR